VIPLVIFVSAVCLIGACAHALDDSEDKGPNVALDALLFALCLLGVLMARKRREESDDE